MQFFPVSLLPVLVNGLIKRNPCHSLSLIKGWARYVDITTVVWLVIFFIGLLAFDSDLFGYDEPLILVPQEMQGAWDILSWIIWGVFVIDVYFKYKAIGNWRIFLRKHWFDLLLLIPFFRILRILRLLRLLKMLKFVKVGRNMGRLFKKATRFKKKT